MTTDNIHLYQLLGEIKADLAAIKHEVAGNGQPGLRQRVEDLEASRNKVWGGLGVLTALGSVIEWLIHRGAR